MNVFLTWSGERSHAVAIALREWIPLILQRIQPFLSSEDIRKGARWQQDIAQQLQSVKYAIVCLTADNLREPWIHFEAGAVSKQLDATKVTSLLIGIEASKVVGPLTQFQNTVASKKDIKKLVKDLNAELGPDQLPEAQLEKTFEMFWPQLDEKITSAATASKTEVKPSRSPQEMLEEILEISRSNSRALATVGVMEDRLTASNLNRLAPRKGNVAKRLRNLAPGVYTLDDPDSFTSEQIVEVLKSLDGTLQDEIDESRERLKKALEKRVETKK